MRLDRSEIDIGTLVMKIESGQIDIQPNFQRGEVWPEAKKKRLIDTILRNWYVPAIHIVVDEEWDQEEILDGQQRLRAIISFMHNEFKIDGSTQPPDESIRQLHGLSYSQLPIRVKSRFDRFPITTVRLREFEPEEPGELFFRLNQLTALTSAEQRNALIGQPRNQVKNLAEVLQQTFSENTFGFSNFRLSYDEVIARLVSAFESGDLRSKQTARSLEDRYRSAKPFSEEAISRAHFSIRRLGAIYNSGIYSKLNKASLFSWLFFFGERFTSHDDEDVLLTNFFAYFEHRRSGSKIFESLGPNPTLVKIISESPSPLLWKCIEVFNDRTFARVNDVSSILLRDLAINLAYAEFVMAGKAKSNDFFGSFISSPVYMELYSGMLALPEVGGGRGTAEAAMSDTWGEYREKHSAR